MDLLKMTGVKRHYETPAGVVKALVLEIHEGESFSLDHRVQGKQHS
ncbi:MAG: hypothetical protein ACKVIR_08040 [Candidatus Poseidoniales archaeon]